jgi:tetratricopeptide (TPR) repeat protein
MDEFHKGNWEQAIAQYTEVVRINPHSAETFFNRALSYSQVKDWENAIRDCTETLRLNPRHLRALHWRGVLLRAQTKFAEALLDFDHALELKPKYARAYFDRGWTYFLINDFSKAAIDLTSAIQLGLDAFDERAIVWVRLKDFDRAAKDSAEAIHRRPEARIYFNAGWISYQQKDIETAIARVSEAIRLGPNVATYFSSRAFYHHARGEYAASIEDDIEALKIDEKNANAHNGLAWIFATCPEPQFRDAEKAFYHARKAVVYGEGKSVAYIGTLAAAYAEAGNFAKAVRWAKKFLESDPPEENIEPARLRLRLYEQGQPYREEKGKMEVIAKR